MIFSLGLILVSGINLEVEKKKALVFSMRKEKSLNNKKNKSRIA